MSDFSLEGALNQKILPAIIFDTEESVLPVAETLLRAGLYIMEIPFRTGVAEKAIIAIRKRFPEMYVGAGTLLSAGQVQTAVNSGAQFGLSPAFNQTVCNEAKHLHLPFIPGVMTPSEIEFANELGYTILKLFPAEQAGGTGFLKAIQGPYEQLAVKFIPMGGVSIDNIKPYLELKNVIAVGGSWMVTKQLMATKDYKKIEKNVIEALQKTQG
ncbi:MAG: bifunctional 4-hydroxy-2-oxoglutarate aldolase/2-dehydro-3-deoxy-phosphogluconate aldolase [Ginsengibacter sp.]